MTASVAAPRRIRRLSAAQGMVLLGAVTAFVSLLALPWYSISGPGVWLNADRSPGQTVLIADSGIGTRHSWGVWLLFVLCVLSAFASVVPGWRLAGAARIAAPCVAAVLILDAVARVAPIGLTSGQHGLGGVLPPDTVFTIGAGFWLALAGFALLGVGPLLSTRPSRRVAGRRPGAGQLSHGRAPAPRAPARLHSRSVLRLR